MNKETFNQLLQKPAHVDPKYKEDLAQLISSFPYSANIRLLYLSALLNDGDIHFEKELKKSAAYIADRRVLRKLIDRPINSSQYIIEEVTSPLQVIQKEEENLEVEVADIPKPQPVENLQTEEPLEETLVIKENTAQSEELEIPTVKEELETPEQQEDTIEEITPEPLLEDTPKEVVSDDEETPSAIPELEDQIIASAVNASLSLEVEETDLSTEKTEEEIVPKEEVTKSFLDWIGAPKDDFTTVTELDPKEQERIEFKRKAENLINQFIANQPRIDVKKEFFSPGNMAKKSVEDKAEIVTETLAGVYAAQGNIPKAINTYQQLILKFPEKKSYFATLIEKLKE